LKYAKWTGSDWSIETVDSGGDVGRYTSLALDTNNRPYISYCSSDAIREGLKFAKWTDYEWYFFQTIASSNEGWYTSIAVNSNNRPYISYYNYESEDLKLFREIGDGIYETSAVDSPGNVGGFTSIELDSNGWPRISYYDFHNSDLKYAKWTNQPPYTPRWPSPADGATNVSIDTDLSWASGDPDPGDTATYDVYFGTAYPPPILQYEWPSTTYSLPELAYDTTYYWQIVARDGHGASTEGPIWHFTTQLLPNDPPYTPHSPNPADGAIGTGTDVDLEWQGGDPDPGDQVRYFVYFSQGTPPSLYDTTPWYSYDQVTITFDLPPLDDGVEYHWKIVAQDNHGFSSVGPIWSFATTNYPPYTPNSPTPADEATGVGTDVDLEWQGGDPNPGDQIEYELYFGTSTPPPYYATTPCYPYNQQTITYDLPVLIYEEQYYWKIIARDLQGLPKEGPIWTFKPAPDEEWNTTFGLEGDDRGYCVQETDDGGFIVVGRKDDRTDDVWLLKTDPHGNVQWDQTYGDEDFLYEGGYGVQQTSDGGYIVVGYYDPYPSVSDVWLIKTYANGNVQWDRYFGGSSRDIGYAVQETADLGFIITGFTLSYGVGGGDVWLLKTDSSGNEVWNRTYGGGALDIGDAVQQTADGGFIIAGRTRSFGAGDYDVWLIKTDSSGYEEWNTTYGGAAIDQGFSVQQTSDTGYIIAGQTSSYGAGSADVWLIKTDSSGNEQWNETYGGTGSDSGSSVDQTFDGGYVLTGTTTSYGAGSTDLWLLKVNATGYLTWQNTYGGSQSDAGKWVQQITSGDYIAVGYTFSYGAGGADMWLLKVKRENQLPETPARPSGQTWGQIFHTYYFTTVTTDPDGDDIYYKWSCSDGSSYDWRGPYPNGTADTVAWSWITPGTYHIKVKAKDVYDAESDWSAALTIRIFGIWPAKIAIIGPPPE